MTTTRRRRIALQVSIAILLTAAAFGVGPRAQVAPQLCQNAPSG